MPTPWLARPIVEGGKPDKRTAIVPWLGEQNRRWKDISEVAARHMFRSLASL